MSPESRKAHAAESEGGVLWLDGEDGVFVPSKVLTGLVETLRRLSGSAAAFYNWGIAFGRELVRRHRDAAPADSDERTLQAVFARFGEYGWGALDLREFAPREGRVRAISPNPINVDWLAYTEAKGPRAEDHFTRGFVAGAASEVLGVELEGLEPMCRANGSEVCAFETHRAGA